MPYPLRLEYIQVYTMHYKTWRAINLVNLQEFNWQFCPKYLHDITVLHDFNSPHISSLFLGKYLYSDTASTHCIKSAGCSKIGGD